MFGLAALVFSLDRVSKILVERYVSTWDTYVVIPHLFNIIHSKNRGAAFGILSETPGEWGTFFLVGLSSLVLVFVAALLWQVCARVSKESRMLRVALALVLGGAIGNVYDRLAYGMVTDFLDFYLGSYHWHTFNVADSAITAGAGILLFDMWRTRNRKSVEGKS
jgi:signal peptidase II